MDADLPVAAPGPVVAEGGARRRWAGLPESVRTAVAARVGAPVSRARDVLTGFSPGVAAVLTADDGTRTFVKVAHVDDEPETARLHRREAVVVAALDAARLALPVPALRWWWEDDAWVAAGYEAVDGRSPAGPWQPDVLRAVLAAVRRVGDVDADALLQASAAAGTVLVLGDATSELSGAFEGWRRLLDEPWDGLAAVDPWAASHVPELAALAARGVDAATGGRLAHGDLRADNVVVATLDDDVFAPARDDALPLRADLEHPDDLDDAVVDELLLSGPQVHVVDWPWAMRAVPWFDVVAMLPSVAVQGVADVVEPLEVAGAGPSRRAVGHLQQALLREVFTPAEAGDEDVRAVVAGLAGYFVDAARRPAPPAIPNLRRFQLAQAVAALAWLETMRDARRTGTMGDDGA